MPSTDGRRTIAERAADNEVCVCGHTARWHSHDGAGDCEGACACAVFVAQRHVEGADRRRVELACAAFFEAWPDADEADREACMREMAPIVAALDQDASPSLAERDREARYGYRDFRVVVMPDETVVWTGLALGTVEALKLFALERGIVGSITRDRGSDALVDDKFVYQARPVDTGAVDG